MFEGVCPLWDHRFFEGRYSLAPGLLVLDLGQAQSRPRNVRNHVTARCKSHPQFEGRGRSKIEALRKLEAAVQLGDAKERAR